MDRITILHENCTGTQTDITLESFTGTRILTLEKQTYVPEMEENAYHYEFTSVHQVVVIAAGNDILVGEHTTEEEAQEQVDRIWRLAGSSERAEAALAREIMAL